MTRKSNVIYVSLDVLLDTRLGTLAKMNPTFAEEVVVNNYHDRVSDIFPCVDREEYLAAWRARDLETLRHSYVTNAPALILHFLGIVQSISVQTPTVLPVRLDVNVWPYVLTPELQQYYVEALETIFPQVNEVVLLSIPDTLLSIAHCKQTYRMMFVYEYRDWLEGRAVELESVQAPELMVYAPAIYHVKEPTQAELDALRKQVPPMHPFESALFEIRPFVGLQLLDPKHFSLMSIR